MDSAFLHTLKTVDAQLDAEILRVNNKREELEIWADETRKNLFHRRIQLLHQGLVAHEDLLFIIKCISEKDKLDSETRENARSILESLLQKD